LREEVVPSGISLTSQTPSPSGAFPMRVWEREQVFRFWRKTSLQRHLPMLSWIKDEDQEVLST
jgi:hypothetical protein